MRYRMKTVFCRPGLRNIRFPSDPFKTWLSAFPCQCQWLAIIKSSYDPLINPRYQGLLLLQTRSVKFTLVMWPHRRVCWSFPFIIMTSWSKFQVIIACSWWDMKRNAKVQSPLCLPNKMAAASRERSILPSLGYNPRHSSTLFPCLGYKSTIFVYPVWVCQILQHKL